MSITTSTIEPKATEVWLAEIPNAIGYQQGGIRPVLITSNNIGNHFSPVVEGIPFTTKKQNKNQPTHAKFRSGEAGLSEDSVLLAEQKCTINKSQLIKRLGKMDHSQVVRAVKAIANANPVLFLAAYEINIQNDPTFQRLAMAH